MATKADAGRNALLIFQVLGSTHQVRFTRVRNWTMRLEREAIVATNNDSSGWRELVVDTSTALAARAGASKNQGQRSWSLHCESVYDVSTVGYDGTAQTAQARNRAQAIGAALNGTPMDTFFFRLGVHKPDSGVSAGYWAQLTGDSSPAYQAYVESVEVGGAYDSPVLFDLTFRGNGLGSFLPRQTT